MQGVRILSPAPSSSERRLSTDLALSPPTRAGTLASGVFDPERLTDLNPSKSTSNDWLRSYPSPPMSAEERPGSVPQVASVDVTTSAAIPTAATTIQGRTTPRTTVPKSRSNPVLGQGSSQVLQTNASIATNPLLPEASHHPTPSLSRLRVSL